jgi:predicted phage terminase large subunit-like protein
MKRREIAPQPGPQTIFSATPAEIAIYGGSAGGGKSFALAYEAARYVNVPGYSAVIFRRNSTQLTGGGSIWEESQKLYPHLHGVPRTSPNLDWRFPSGAMVEFRHLQHEWDVYDHQSKQYSYCGFDELTSFAGSQFWYMLSRVRGAAQVPKRIRGTCNPDPDSFVRELISWYIGKNGRAIEERSGVIRWFVRLDQRLIWGASPDEVWQQDPRRILRRGAPRESDEDTRPEPMSFTFVRARASDNKVLMRADPGYLARLNMLPGAERERLLDGNWDARDKPGDFFDRSWCRIIDAIAEKNVVRRIRFWDKAATSPSDDNPDPDWTRGVLVALLDSGEYVVEDLRSAREGPAAVDKLLRETATADGIEVQVGAWQDPGQAGLVDVEHMRTLLLDRSFLAIRASKDKKTYARVWTPKAEAGRVLFLRREYLPELFSELEGFPLRRHDDIMDALSGAFQVLLGGAFEFGYDAAADDRHGTKVRDAWDDDEDSDEDDDEPAGRGAFF